MHFSLPFRKTLIAATTALALFAVTPAFAKDVTVSISNFKFPAETTIEAGDTVVFVNDDDTIHSVVGDDNSFHSDGLDTGDKFSYTFAKAGTVPYHCGLHPFMTGKIIVK